MWYRGRSRSRSTATRAFGAITGLTIPPEFHRSSTCRGESMRSGLLTAIGIVAAVGGILSLFFVFSMVKPPDETAYVLGGLWILMPYLTALLVAGLCRRY